MRVEVKKANPTAGVEVPDLELVATEPIGEPGRGPGWAEEADERHWRSARSVVDALSASLPGGTLDRVLAEMMSRKACLLSVPIGFAPGRSPSGDPARAALEEAAKVVLDLRDAVLSPSIQIVAAPHTIAAVRDAFDAAVAKIRAGAGASAGTGGGQ